MKKTILITGASGFIGARIYKSLNEHNTVLLSRQEKFQTDKKLVKCDLTNLNEIKRIIKKIHPDVVYHFAALTSPKRNEKNPKDARLLNVGITENLIKAIDKQKTHIIFLSTDKVFDGSKVDPDEMSETNPLWVYGSFKLECEKTIGNKMLKHHIIRLPIVHGNGEENSSSFIDEALINLSRDNQVKAFDNVKRCYVRLDELIDFLKKLIDDSHYGLYHAGSSLMSYYERIAMLCIENDIVVNGRLVPVEGYAKPPVQNLNTRKLEKTFNFSFS